jgi:hypothetical protein
MLLFLFFPVTLLRFFFNKQSRSGRTPCRTPLVKTALGRTIQELEDAQMIHEQRQVLDSSGPDLFHLAERTQIHIERAHERYRLTDTLISRLGRSLPERPEPEAVYTHISNLHGLHAVHDAIQAADEVILGIVPPPLAPAAGEILAQTIPISQGIVKQISLLFPGEAIRIQGVYDSSPILMPFRKNGNQAIESNITASSSRLNENEFHPYYLKKIGGKDKFDTVETAFKKGQWTKDYNTARNPHKRRQSKIDQIKTKERPSDNKACVEEPRAEIPLPNKVEEASTFSFEPVCDVR